MNELKRLINKFRTTEIVPALERWGHLDQHDLNEIRLSGSKQNMVSEAHARCEEKDIHEKAVSELDLIHAQFHSKQKTWNVYELNDPKRDTHVALIPAGVQKKLHRKLDHYFNSMVNPNYNMYALQYCCSFRGAPIKDICAVVHKRALWLRLCVEKSVRGGRGMVNPSDTIYMVHYPRTQVLLATNVKVSFKDIVMESVMSVLGYTTAKDMQLKGHCVNSLADLALNRNSQGGFRKYQPEGDHDNPLIPRRKKRKEPEEEFDVQILREDENKRRKTTQILEKTFGPDVQPTLEKIEYKLETQFRGFGLIRDKAGSGNLSRIEQFLPVLERYYHRNVEPKAFQCKVKFEGSNVLEGLRSMGKMGLASVPLPKHLSCVPSQAKNHFILGDKNRVSRGMRSPAA